ncbi:nucleotidyltransferase substrate binding protein [Catenovulum adriaticum]|uniref:Nucleotidyltransferase substrate binding protein n=1 Tax=Catenovulum adriaticum TaxID=2984846 RepID=A0ABY7AT84_9ALTE|nr:nucleotidyltransferase substrate binding protein [Catenovulum sp. TS8]
MQRFEFTGEVRHKMLKRFLESSAADPTEFEQASFQYIIRSANEKALLKDDWTHWHLY